MIKVTNLTKAYDKVKAVEDVSLNVENGKITILLGPNGAGKSTTIKSIAGLLKFDGVIEVDGFKNQSVEAKRAFGYIPEAPTLYDALTIEEHIKFIGKAYQVSDYEAYGDELLERFDLLDKKKTIVKKLSKGMGQKVSMILALIPHPTALMVDEPMMGLDPSAIEEVLKLLVELKKQGCSILISTHIIDIVDGIWDEAYIMKKGKIVKEVSHQNLKEHETLKEIFFECLDGE